MGPLQANLLAAVNGKVDKAVAVSPFVIVPRNNLVEVVIQCNACLGIDNGTAGIVAEILRDEVGVTISKDSLQFTLRRLLQGSQ